jgi:methionyl-tRNA synthetase
MPATRIDPVKLSDALAVGPLGRPIGIDAMRYYLLREVPLGLDGDFTFESLFGRFNAELANDLGNLVNRSLTLMAKSALHPARDPFIAESGVHPALEQSAKQAIADATAEYEAMAPSRALEAIWKLVRDANKYVGDTQPWALAKDPSKATELAHVYHMLASVIGIVGGLVTPVLPTTGRTLRTWVGVPEAELDHWPAAADLARIVGALEKEPAPMYPRLDKAKQDAIFEALVPKEAAPAPATPATAQITYEDFAKLELRVGKVVSAEAVPKKDKLLHLKVDLGEARPRTIIAGIAQAFAPDALVGKSVIVVANLAPRKMAGLTSEGMILAAGDERILGLSAVDRDVPPGTRVR